MAGYQMMNVANDLSLQWKTLDSAPLDGTEVLVWYDFATVPIVHIAWYNSPEEYEYSGKYSSNETLEQYVGWWSYVENSISQHKLEGYNKPTHWMEYHEPVI